MSPQAMCDRLSYLWKVEEVNNFASDVTTFTDRCYHCQQSYYFESFFGDQSPHRL